MIDLLIFSKKYCRKYKLRLCIGLLLIILSNILTIIPIPYIGNSINIIKDLLFDISKKNLNINYINKIFLYTSIILIIPIIGGIVKYYMRQFIITTSRMIEVDIKNEIFSHYQKLGLSFYKKNSTGDLMNRITEDVSFIRQYIGPGMMYFINLISLFTIVFIQMFRLDKSLTIYVVIPIPILFLIIYYLSSNIAICSKKVQEYQSNICSFIQETFSGIHIVKSFSSEYLFYKKHRKIVLEYKKKNISLSIYESILYTIIIFFIGVSHLLILFFGGIKYFNGEIKEIGIIAEFFTYINILIFPIVILGWVVVIIERAKVSKIRINKLLNEKQTIYNVNKFEKKKLYGKIQFKNVSFSFNNYINLNILNNISFKLMNGETLVLTGEVGSGKTTIGKLILRLYNDYQGDILIDNYSIKNYNLYNIRNNIGYVPQESFLFSDSIYNNIALGSIKKVTKEEIYNAAKKAMINDEIINFKNGYNTMVGEKGVTLSGGQKQRICIARALIKNPKILIFDDSFSAIDQKKRKLIIDCIKKNMKNITTIIITHDISYISNFNLLITLKKGKIFKIKNFNKKDFFNHK
ncbi:ABC transporter ATP-binding protein [Blattabacterium cuenoti]|uniref:ABC transporter ATP-binding protein n=1 Tax=Blattabacterium cuenoti TaxID=1653831 RepID=UPI00163C153F|nr:ABC transporter ATP-binding protein [Blattabacterium cuenoti]